jgi:hypothetical protein
MKTLAWGLLALVGVLWPSRVVGPIDGAPLDTFAEVILAGVVLPFAWMLHAHVFRAAAARVLVAALVAWKLGTWVLLTQQGLCATFAMSSGASDHLVLRRSWDFRTSAPEGLARCSAVVTRSLDGQLAFPAWFLNLPVGHDRNLDAQQQRLVEPPQSPHVVMHVAGYLSSSDGVRAVEETTTLGGSQWRFDMPGADHVLATATIDPPSTADALARYLWFVSPALTMALLCFWAYRGLARLRMPAIALTAWAALTGASIVLGLVGEPYARGIALLLATVLVLRLPYRLQNRRAVVLFIGLPLLAMLAAGGASQVGRFTMYSAGDDWQTFQRFAARIYFDGHWLEGGSATFWYQALYRWIAGMLHVVFGDSSVGELYWDGYGLLASATLAYALVRMSLSFRWALAASLATLATTLLGPNWYLVGRGLAEISALMWVALTALALARARAGHVTAAIRAGVLATLAIYTRMNHLILLAAMVVLLLPRLDAGAWTRPVALLRTLRLQAAFLYGAVVAAGLVLLAARSWYYNGVFSLSYGTSMQFHSTGLAFDTLADPAVWRRVFESLAVMVTVSDPARFDPRSVLVLLGVAIALLALLRMPVARELPLAPVVLCLAATSSAFAVRGLAYPGRFSLHLIPLAVSVSVLFAARLAHMLRVSSDAMRSPDGVRA